MSIDKRNFLEFRIARTKLSTSANVDDPIVKDLNENATAEYSVLILFLARASNARAEPTVNRCSTAYCLSLTEPLWFTTLHIALRFQFGSANEGRATAVNKINPNHRTAVALSWLVPVT